MGKKEENIIKIREAQAKIREIQSTNAAFNKMVCYALSDLNTALFVLEMTDINYRVNKHYELGGFYG